MSSFQLLNESSESMVAVALPPSNVRVGGNLRYAPEGGVNLELFDTSRDIGSIFTGTNQHYPAILGQLHGGPPFTLLDCFPSNTNIGGGGFAHVSLVANVLLKGIHLQNPAQSVFDELRVSMSSLNDWIRLRPIQHELRDLPAPRRGREVSITCQHLDVVGFSPLNSGPSLLTDQDINSSWQSADSASVRSRFFLRLLPRNPFSAEMCAQELFRLQAFISLLCGHQVFFDEVRLYLHGTAGRDRQMSSVHYLAEFSQSEDRKRSRRHEILLPLPAVMDLLPEIWMRWIDRYEQYQSAIELYTSTEIFSGQLLNFQFLAIMQALETLHRNRFGGSYFSPTDYAAVYTSLNSALTAVPDPDLRSALKSRLKYGNEYSLRKRLTELSRILPAGVLRLIHPDPIPFLARAVDTRNYFTHFDASLKSAAFEDNALYWGTRLLRWFFIAVVLNDLGISEGTLVRALEGAEALSHARAVVLGTPRGPAIIVESVANAKGHPATSAAPTPQGAPKEAAP